ncbi:hypothetical protein BGX38DRAFT_1141555 [Terfezia claveryi]|nr:hypothetical protein BGX38DRAFT_1141555 [Terfezia claveryi]
MKLGLISCTLRANGVAGNEVVANLKEAIKKQQEAKLKAYPTTRLTIKAKKEKDEDNEAVELDETEEVASALKKHGTWLLVQRSLVTSISDISIYWLQAYLR